MTPQGDSLVRSIHLGEPEIVGYPELNSDQKPTVNNLLTIFKLRPRAGESGLSTITRKPQPHSLVRGLSKTEEARAGVGQSFEGGSSPPLERLLGVDCSRFFLAESRPWNS